MTYLQWWARCTDCDQMFKSRWMFVAKWKVRLHRIANFGSDVT